MAGHVDKHGRPAQIYSTAIPHQRQAVCICERFWQGLHMEVFISFLSAGSRTPLPALAALPPLCPDSGGTASRLPS